jgi:hypothetical protein
VTFVAVGEALARKPRKADTELRFITFGRCQNQGAAVNGPGVEEDDPIKFMMK